MSREWKPGDVGLVNKRERLFRTPDGWVDYEGDRRPILRNSPHVRPLVVIDPEDREQVERLARSYLDNTAAAIPLGVLTGRMEAALRGLIEPPKPDEPTGRYAVVEDDKALEWVQVDLPPTQTRWHSIDGPESKWRRWSEINAVKVLSEGVQS